MMSAWSYKLIFEPQQGLPVGIFEAANKVLERLGFSLWTSPEYAPDYAISTTEAREVIVVSTFVGFEYQTLLSDNLEEVEEVLTRYGGNLELRAGHDVIELGFDPGNSTLSLGVLGACHPETQTDLQTAFLKLCNKLKPIAGCGYNLEALSKITDLQDDFPRAILQGRLPKHLYNLTYLSLEGLEQIGLERIRQIAQRLDYWEHGVCLWLDRSEMPLIAELGADGSYHKLNLQGDYSSP